MSTTPEDAASRNKTLMERLTRAFNELDRETFDACYADEITVHSRQGHRTMNHDEHWEEVLDSFETFPDLEATMHGLVAEDDRVFGRWTYAGTFQGPVDGAAEEPDAVDADQIDGEAVEETAVLETEPSEDSPEPFIPPEAPGTFVEYQHWSEYRVANGRIEEAWQLSDALGVNLELGFVEEVTPDHD